MPPCVITLTPEPVSVTRQRVVIAAAVEETASNVDTRGVGEGCGVVTVALTAGVEPVTVGRSEVAVSVGVMVAVHALTRAGIVRSRSARTFTVFFC